MIRKVTEIMVNGAAHIFYEKHGVLYPMGKKGQLSEERLRDMIQRMVALQTALSMRHSQLWIRDFRMAPVSILFCSRYRWMVPVFQSENFVEYQ